MESIPRELSELPPGRRLPSPHLEVLTRPANPDPGPRLPWYRAQRLRIFVAVVLVVLIPGLAWDFLRPPQYRAAAAVVTVATPLPGISPEAAPAQNVQHTRIQARVLLGQELLVRTLARVDAAGDSGTPSDPDALRDMLEVTSVPDTQLVELAAVGGEPERLAEIVNTWIESYQEQRQEAVEREVGAARAALGDEYDSLGGTIEDKRAAMDAFRAQHDIVTLERDGNESLARLAALNLDLNRARDEAVEADARLAALEGAIARGDPVVPASEQGNLAALEEKAIELRARLTELGKRFTPFYLDNEPDVRVIPAQLAQIEAKIEEKMSHGRRLMLTQAQGEVAQARQRVAVLEGDLEEVKEAAALFSTRFAEHEALKEDLTRLEEMYREAGVRLVDMEAKALERFPAVKVIEPAHPPASPFYPHYWRDALLVLAGALTTGLLVILLFEFLTRLPRALSGPEPGSVTGIRVYTGGAALAAGEAGPGLGSPAPMTAVTGPVASEETVSLPAALPRELIPAETGALWALADALSRQFLVLLLSGLTLEECAGLAAEHFDLTEGAVAPPAPRPRRVPLPPQTLHLFTASQPLPLWGGAEPHSPADLEARIALLACDAGLTRPDEITAAVLRHTWLAFLVRQGARLTELERISGPMPASTLARYARLAPAGPARPLDAVDLIYPLPG